MSSNNPPDNSSKKEMFFDDIPELDTLPINNETDLSIEDYLLDDDQVEFVFEPQASEITEIENLMTSSSTEQGQSSNEITEKEKLQTSISGANPSTSAAKGESSSKEVCPTEVVKYDYIFNKGITETEVTGPMVVNVFDAEKHFPRLTDQVTHTKLHLYDYDCEQRREWELNRFCRMYFIYVNWKKCIEDNGLEAGDRVVFYKTESDQIVGNELPRYVVKFKKFPWEDLDKESLYIPVHKLA